MGVRIEVVLFIIIALILALTPMIKVTNKSIYTEISTKEMDFTDTTIIEVDINKTQGRSYSTHGVRDEGVLTLYNLVYHTDQIESLTADQGILKGDDVYLDYNIIVNQKQGYDYSADHAVYNQKTEILNITSPFAALMNDNVILGETLRYNLKTKEAFATRVDAVIYTVEK